MSVRIAWGPSTNTAIASYEVQSSSALGGPYVVLANVPHNLAGPDYDAPAGLFFYIDAVGSLTTWYRLIAIDSAGNRSIPSAPLEPTSASPTITNVVKVDHNYGSPGALRYQTAGGVPVEAAIVRVYSKTLFDQGLTDTALAITLTDSRGNWVNPVSLTAGFTYTVQFAKEGLYGPDKTEIVV